MSRLSAKPSKVCVTLVAVAALADLAKANFTVPEEPVLLLVALAHAARDLGLAWRERVTGRAWAMQGRLTLAFLVIRGLQALQEHYFPGSGSVTVARFLYGGPS